MGGRSAIGTLHAILPPVPSLAPHIDDFGDIKTHEAWVARLKRHHGLKVGFWSLMGS